jgi:ketosteroid isomerase-like protein
MKERFEEAWEDFEDDLQELFEANDKVISVVRSGGHGRASGAEVAITHYGVWTLRDRKITRVDWFGSREDALDSAGPND